MNPSCFYIRSLCDFLCKAKKRDMNLSTLFKSLAESRFLKKSKYSSCI
jgi:hypothetical protein